PTPPLPSQPHPLAPQTKTKTKEEIAPPTPMPYPPNHEYALA
ncbi:MAG: hypothetical protein ACI9X4_000366, partial [Glaciecola sp.]